MKEGGFTLIEILVVLGILGILAAVTLPYAELTVKRDKELELRRDLREIRTAIDRFHDDWASGALAPTDGGVSQDGYPKTLQVLVEGAEATGPRPINRKYLRRVPANPFADPTLPVEAQWSLRSYADDPKAGQWGGQDVYDIRSVVPGKALDGSHYEEW